MDRMAAELVTMKQKQEVMDNMAAEMFQMKELIKSLRPPAPKNSSLADQVKWNTNICNVPTQPTTTINSSLPYLPATYQLESLALIMASLV